MKLRAVTFLLALYLQPCDLALKLGQRVLCDEARHLALAALVALLLLLACQPAGSRELILQRVG